MDALCFVMGIKRHELLRCANFKELIYGQGAGIIDKASVTVIFDNKDVTRQPIGYTESTITIQRTIDRHGTDNYVINGCNKNLTDVKNLLNSVKVNIDNPHFMVMQNQVTKISQMGDKALLSLLEEASGTKTYDDKAKYANSMIEKKQKTITDINNKIDNDISPAMIENETKVKDYKELNNIKNNITDINKRLIAYTY